MDARFFQGDLQSFGGVKINGTGRIRHRGDTPGMRSSITIIGHGAGSADDMIIALGLGASHPHNDYLRFLDDFGAVDFVLWVVGTVAVLRHLWIRWRSSLSDEERQLYGTAVLGLFGVNMCYADRQCGIYIYVMAPLGAVMGLAMGCGQYSVTPHSSEVSRRGNVTFCGTGDGGAMIGSSVLGGSRHGFIRRSRSQPAWQCGYTGRWYRGRRAGQQTSGGGRCRRVVRGDRRI